MKEVQLYTLSTCPWCTNNKKFFTDHHIHFQYTDYDLADAAMQGVISRELEDAGASSFPFVRIGSEVIEGYQPARFAEVLHIEGEPA